MPGSLRDREAEGNMLTSTTDSVRAAASAVPFETALEAEFQAWLASEYLPIAGGWHY
jgi:hypothetical protein